MQRNYGLWVVAAAVCLLAVASQLTHVAAKPDPGQLAAMADALKYLQELDKYYSQVARPRFGKRMELRPVPEDGSASDGSEKLWGHLARRR